MQEDAAARWARQFGCARSVSSAFVSGILLLRRREAQCALSGHMACVARAPLPHLPHMARTHCSNLLEAQCEHHSHVLLFLAHLSRTSLAVFISLARAPLPSSSSVRASLAHAPLSLINPNPLLLASFIWGFAPPRMCLRVACERVWGTCSAVGRADYMLAHVEHTWSALAVAACTCAYAAYASVYIPIN